MPNAGRRPRPRPRRGIPGPGAPAGVARVQPLPGNSEWHPNGSYYNRLKRTVLEMYRYRCWICGCLGSPTSGLAIDHVVPLSECAVNGIDPWDIKNWRPAHHGKPCPYCSAASLANGNKAIRCNQLRGSGSVERARQIIADRTGKTIEGIEPSKGKPRSAPAEPRGERAW